MTRPPRTTVVASCPSTQALAKAALEHDDAQAGDAFVALQQTAGRGRRGRSWQGGSGVFVSLVVEPAPPLPVALSPRVVFAAAAAVREVVQGLVPLRRVRLKWPNDVVVEQTDDEAATAPAALRLGGHRKIGGLLLEAVRVSTVLERAVLGVGVNVAPPPAGWPAELSDTATSLRELGGVDGDDDEVRAALQEALLPALRRALHHVSDAAFPSVLAAHREHSATVGRVVAVGDGADVVRGVAVGLGSDGALHVHTAAGEVVPVYAGDAWSV